MTLPRFVVVKSNHNKKYLRYLKKEDGEEDVPSGFLKFTGEEAGSHYAKYEVEMAKSTENKGFVHIRCCYNNKYWVSVNGMDKFEGDVLIVAGADEPEEDQSKPSCTLFEPVYVDPIDDEDDDNKPDDKAEDDLEEDSQVVQFRHVQLGRYTCLHNDSDALVLFGGSNSTTDDPNNLESRDVCTVVNWESLVILPKHVVFKGDDDNYITAQMSEHYGDDDDGDGPHLMFHGNDINDPGVANEIFMNADGTLQIKNIFFERYWRLAKEEWIWADAFNPTARDKNYKDTLYKAIKLSDKAIALINVGNNNYCKRYASGICALSANVPNLSIFSHLKVEEPVKSRTIYNVKYRLDHARIYNYQTDFEIATAEAVNFTQETTTVTLKLLYKRLSSCSWNDINRIYSMKLKTTIEAPGVPRITTHEGGLNKVEISDGFKGDIQWGETEAYQTEVETVCVVDVPAKSELKVRLLATTASCDVPFSYSRHDTRTNGQVHVTNDLDDGFYSGINAFNFKYNTKEEKLG
ncbi:uncharacterized protein Pyn_38100 [Prunus yedoensis var. nudiflora]|uniref:Agglutinin domain-containing protein n=1 Tax=Prunus yedoensis var. nudiflora TaxID=2094558 RepID=A0A314UHW9_PRUYE|nr:uncharacterized protein Pyn_38100 [Prunus yedoensis var. nudiflora]